MSNMNGNESRRTGILRLRHLLETTEAKGDELAEQRDRFKRLTDPASSPRVVSAFNLFQTPPELAARLASLFDHFGRVLEPSAGLGRLYRAVRERSPDCEITLVDSSAECCGELYRTMEGDASTRLIAGDFLGMDESRLGLFDAIIMNPPFRMGADIRHVLHATTLLAAGGRVVSIVANGSRQQAKLKPIATRWIELGSEVFTGEGTNVNAAIVILDRN